MLSIIPWLGATAIGLSLGLLGSGGSILTVPVLVYLPPGANRGDRRFPVVYYLPGFTTDPTDLTAFDDYFYSGIAPGSATLLQSSILTAATELGRVETTGTADTALASFITLSAGGSSGREGPVVHLAGVISTKLARWIKADGITGGRELRT